MQRRLGKRGVLVLNVLPGGGAEAAGIKPTRQLSGGGIALGDMIKEVDGQEIDDSNDLYRALDDNEVGETVTVKVERDDKTETVEVKLGAVKE